MKFEGEVYLAQGRPQEALAEMEKEPELVGTAILARRLPTTRLDNIRNPTRPWHV